MGKKKLPTIIDVAKRANVSKSTVSKYLNGKGYVSEDASRKISEAIQELGYVPSIVAKSLATRRTYMIGTVINNIRNPFFSELAAAIEQEARKYGYDNLLISSHDDIEAWQTQIYAIQRRSLDGVINATSMALDERHAISVPVVYVNTTISGQFDLVILDNYMGGWMAAEYLIKRGHRHVACIHGPLAKSVFNERVHGFRACLAHYGWPAREELFIEVAFATSEDGFRATQMIMDRAKPPLAIWGANDFICFGVLQYASAVGLSVPDDLSIIGFDNIEWSRYTYVPLTTVDSMITAMGVEAVKLLMKRINGDEGMPIQIILKPTVVERASVSRLE